MRPDQAVARLGFIQMNSRTSDVVGFEPTHVSRNTSGGHMNALLRLSLIGALGCWAAESTAIPVLSIDMDPVAAGIQGTLTVEQGATFQIDVVLDTDGNDVAGFELDISPGGVNGFPAMATGIDVLPVFGTGDTLGFPNTVVDEQTLDNGSGEAAVAASQGVFGTPANGASLRLATLDYEAIAVGSLDMDINDFRLTDSVGGLLTASVFDGAVDITSAVPAPAAAMLIATGLLSLRWRPRSARACAVNNAQPS